MTSCGTGCDGPSQFYLGDIGTEIIVDVCSDISTATLVSLKVMKPDGTEHTWVGTVYQTQYIRYITQLLQTVVRTSQPPRKKMTNRIS